MPVPEKLLKVLVCPAPDHGRLIEEFDNGVPVLSCTVCGSRFTIEGSIPVMLLSQAATSSVADGNVSQAGTGLAVASDSCAGDVSHQSQDLS